MSLPKEKIVELLMKHNILPSPELLDSIETEEDIEKVLKKLQKTDAVVLTSDVMNLIDTHTSDINWRDFESGRVQKEKGKNSDVYNGFIDYLSDQNNSSSHPSSSHSQKHTQPESSHEQSNSENQPNNNSTRGNVKVVFDYTNPSIKRDVQHFVAYYNNRFKTLESILSSRQELQNLTSISRVLAKRDKENIAIIGMVKEKSFTKNNNLMLTLEDPTGEIRVVVSKSKPDLFNEAKDIVPDEVLGITGVNGDKIIFANNVIWPDVPLINEKKQSPDETYAVFLSDIHVGSNEFLPDELTRFTNWISGEAGSETQKEIASKVKYVFIVGDLVDGVGIFPGQEKELDIPDIYEQYAKVTEFIKKIPQNIQIIICPGNHDAIRIAEPQPKLGNGFSESLKEISNATLVSNPSLINIHSSDEFSGFNVLMYHGYSFDHYVANVDSIRTSGGYDRADLIMKFMLQRRHLAPTHGSTLIIPETESDPLTISILPDFFVTGHIHKCSVSSYRGITLICGSCWQATTSFQKKVGHHPEPARVPIVNLQTREVKILRF